MSKKILRFVSVLLMGLPVLLTVLFLMCFGFFGFMGWYENDSVWGLGMFVSVCMLMSLIVGILLMPN